MNAAEEVDDDGTRSRSFGVARAKNRIGQQEPKA